MPSTSTPAARAAGQRAAEAAGWTPERVEKLKQLWTSGHSASQCAAALGGTTRAAVTGKVHRLGLAGGSYATDSTAVRRKPSAPPVRRAVFSANGLNFHTPESVTRKFAIAGNGALMISGEPAAPKAPVKAGAFDALPGSAPRPFWERPPFGCKWPIGDDALSCCEPSETGRYCPAHEDMARGAQPKTRTGNELARSLRRYA